MTKTNRKRKAYKKEAQKYVRTIQGTDTHTNNQPNEQK